MAAPSWGDGNCGKSPDFGTGERRSLVWFAGAVRDDLLAPSEIPASSPGKRDVAGMARIGCKKSAVISGQRHHH
jgi:hypothetical protein